MSSSSGRSKVQTVFFFRARANVLTTRLRRLEGNVPRVKRIARTDDAFNKSRPLSRKTTTTTTTKLRAKHSHKLYLKRGVVASLVLSRASSFSLESTSRNDDDETKERRALLLQNVVKARFRRLFRRLFRRRLLLLLVFFVVDRKKLLREEESPLQERATGRTRSVAEKRGFGTGFSVGKDEGKERRKEETFASSVFASRRASSSSAR